MLHKAYITFGLKSRLSLLKNILFVLMINSIGIYSQQTLNNYGFINNLENSNFRMNSLESNINNYSSIEDWELSLEFKSIMNRGSNFNINSFSIGKNINDNYLYMRFSPGISQEFLFNSRTEFIVGDSVQNYKTNLSYSEKYGFGYSYKISNNFSIGATFRYFQQKFNEEYPSFFSSDSTQIIQVRDEKVNKNFWRGDIGIEYLPYDNLSLSISSMNLGILKDFDEEDNLSEFNIRKELYNINLKKGFVIGVKYFPSKKLSIAGRFESTSSFLLGSNYNINLNSAYIAIGTTIIHDKYQSPFLTGILPSINYSNNLFSITVSYLKYLENRTRIKSIEDFGEFGIHNIQNNYFSSDRLNVMFNFALSFKTTKRVKFIDIEVNNDVFPTFKENYIDNPFATGKVVNLSTETVSIKPSCFILGITDETIFSPIVTIQPNDTIDVPFFITISDQRDDVKKTKISQANFYINTLNEDPDDELRKPVLVHEQNNWDGNVSNLKYFVKSDLDYSKKFANNILKNQNSNIEPSNKIVENVRILFNEFVKDMKYVSDRRATVDYVQFPRETIELQGGDCDDLSVCFSSILESVGIQTAFIDYKPTDEIGHVTLLINTSLIPQNATRITNNERKYFVRKNYSGREEIWLPIEVTKLTDFDEAWNVGAEKFYTNAVDQFGLSKGIVEIVDVY